MAQEAQVSRLFEQPPDAASFYCDLAQVIGTQAEVVLQFYETIPGPPSGPTGQVTTARSRLRATIVVSKAHAANIGRLLLQKVGADDQKPTPAPDVRHS